MASPELSKLKLNIECKQGDDLVCSGKKLNEVTPLLPDIDKLEKCCVAFRVTALMPETELSEQSYKDDYAKLS